jgi:3-oxoacyl-[acyl-carrier-protein] synthase-1
MSAYYLNDLGILCTLGTGRDAVARALFAGSRAGLAASEKYSPGRSFVVGEITDELPALPTQLRELDCRNNRLAFAALQQIRGTVDAMRKRYGSARIGVVMGTSTSGIGATEIALIEYQRSGALPADYHYRQQQLGALSECVARLMAVSGPTFTISTACSSSANALGSARRLLAMNLCDAVIVGGVDTLCQLTVQGFASLESLSAGYCNPFSANRDGINIGEAGAIFVLSREPGPVRLAGVGASSDAHHISAPEPGGRGAIAAMQMALTQAQKQPGDIDYLNLHGTGTRQNDAMESLAVHSIFGAQLPCSSTKAMTGHTLGAAGALEAGLCWLLLTRNDGCLPPHVWDDTPDPAIAQIRLARGGEAIARIDTCLSNSFAFGGNNTSVLLERQHG